MVIWLSVNIRDSLLQLPSDTYLIRECKESDCVKGTQASRLTIPNHIVSFSRSKHRNKLHLRHLWFNTPPVWNSTRGLPFEELAPASSPSPKRVHDLRSQSIVSTSRSVRSVKYLTFNVRVISVASKNGYTPSHEARRTSNTCTRLSSRDWFLSEWHEERKKREILFLFGAAFFVDARRTNERIGSLSKLRTLVYNSKSTSSSRLMVW